MNLHLVLGHEDCLIHDMDMVVAAAITGGITHVQLREKNLNTRAFFATGQRLQKLLKAANIPLIINDRIDIALALDADGVHLGQSDLPYFAARALLGPNKIIGLTINTLKEMQDAHLYDADYLGVGPVFATISKADASAPLGLAEFTQLAKLARQPVIAIGGINSQNLPKLCTANIAGIAVISAITHNPDPHAATQNLVHLLRENLRC